MGNNQPITRSVTVNEKLETSPEKLSSLKSPSSPNGSWKYQTDDLEESCNDHETGEIFSDANNDRDDEKLTSGSDSGFGSEFKIIKNNLINLDVKCEIYKIAQNIDDHSPIKLIDEDKHGCIEDDDEEFSFVSPIAAHKPSQQQSESKSIDMEKLKNSLLLVSETTENKEDCELDGKKNQKSDNCPIPPPCTPVSATSLSTNNTTNQSQNNNLEATLMTLTKTAVPSINKQELIEDALLLDQQSAAPLAQQENSFTSINEQQNSSFKLENIFEKLSLQTNTTDNEDSTINNLPSDTDSISATNVNLFSKLLNDIAQTSLVEYRFEYEAHERLINEIKVTGSFNNWTEQLVMSKDENKPNCWYKLLHLAPGDYEYKFIIDNEWTLDDRKPVRGINNHLIIAKP